MSPANAPRNLLIQGNTSDTLNACADVLNFMLDSMREVDMESNRSVASGAQWVSMLVIDAVSFESKRTAV